MNKDAKVYVAGHRGLVGSAILRKLKEGGYKNIIVRTHAELDLCNQTAVRRFFASEKPEYVFLAAAKVGGIHANSQYPAQFIYQNLSIETNVIHAAYESGVKKLLFLGSSCIYPKHAPQPMKEEHLLTGVLEPTNESYAIAKIAGIKMCAAYNREFNANFISVMPSNVYGPGDNYDLQNSHVLPALIRKIHEAKESGAKKVVVWGTGKPRREFLYSEDLADACVFIMQQYDQGEVGEFINIGAGKDITIRELAELISSIVGFDGELAFDAGKPDGTPQKLLDISKLNALGWGVKTSLREGIQRTYKSYLQNRLQAAS